MAHAGNQTEHAATIVRLIEDEVAAIRSKDVNKVTAILAPEVLSCDLIEQLRYSGAEAVRSRTEAWFSSFQGPIGYDVRDLIVTAGDDIGFCHHIHRVTGTLNSGESVDLWVRATSCFQRIGFEWTIVH